MKISPLPVLLSALSISYFVISTPASAQPTIAPAEARAIAREAYIYGYPLVDNYRILYAYAVDKTNKEYKAPFNTLTSEARVFTPDDRTIQTPNSDTPYSFFVADLRTEPLVITVPPMEKNRYFSVQFVDLYTFNFAYLGSRTTGNKGGRYLLAGPGWKGKALAGFNKVTHADTDLVLVIYRTQLFSPDDIDNVKRIQDGYKLQTLSSYLKQPAPKAAPAVGFVKPLTPETQKSSLEFFNVLRFALQFAPVDPTEKALRERFRKIGIVPGKAFDANSMPAAIQAALKEGMADGQKEIDAKRAVTHSASDLMGTRAFLKNNFLNRAVGTQMGIYGNSKEEAFYAGWSTEADGKNPLDTSKNRYVVRFPPGQLPPVNAFWSVTMYDVPAQLLVANKINRYLINSPMLPNLTKDADGGLTLYIQKEPPSADKDSNWLPAPDGRAFIVLRAYWPKPAILNGKWKVPPIERAS